MSQITVPMATLTEHPAAGRMATLTQDGWAAHLAAWAAAYQRACEIAPPGIQTLSMAGVTFHLHMAGPALKPAILPALAHLLAGEAPHTAPDITFHLWDTATTGVLPPRPPFTAADYRRYGQRAVAHDGAVSLMHAPTVPLLYVYDRAQRHGFFWTADAAQLSIYERAAPLQTLFHWALREFGWQIIHAAGVGTAAGGVLLIGNTGAGKSTTALSCLTGDGLRLLSDDKCLARLDPAPQAFAAFSSGKIKADMLERLPHFREKLRGWDDHVKAGKGLVYLYPDYAERLVTTFPIKALVVTRVARQTQAAIHPFSPGDAFRVFGPSTVIWLPGAEMENYRFTAELTRRLPCYQLDLALEPARNSEAILELLERLP
jgi:hypothetical protein